MAAVFPPKLIRVGFNANAPASWRNGYDPLVTDGPPNGTQRSQIADIVLFFDQKVTVTGQGIILELLRPNVYYDGVWQPGGYGAVPSYTISTPLSGPNTDYMQIVGAFGAPGGRERADGVVVLRDGVYVVRVDPNSVVAQAVPHTPALPDRHAFGTLFGDTSGEEPTPSGGSNSMILVVNTGDNLTFRNVLNHPGSYRPDLDYDGDGVINTGDNFEFRSRFNKQLVWEDSSQ